MIRGQCPKQFGKRPHRCPVVSPIRAANAMHPSAACTGQVISPCIGKLQWAGTCPPSKVPLPMGDLNPYLTHSSLDSLESAPQTASRSVQPLLHSSPVHRHTDHATCDICSNRPHLRTACRRCGLKLLWPTSSVAIARLKSLWPWHLHTGDIKFFNGGGIPLEFFGHDLELFDKSLDRFNAVVDRLDAVGRLLDVFIASVQLSVTARQVRAET